MVLISLIVSNLGKSVWSVPSISIGVLVLLQWILDLVTILVSVKSVTKSRNVTKFTPTYTTKSKNGQRQNCHYIKDCH